MIQLDRYGCKENRTKSQPDCIDSWFVDLMSRKCTSASCLSVNVSFDENWVK